MIKAWQSTCGRVGVPHHLPGVVDAKGGTVTSTQRPEIGHAHAIGAGDKGMVSTCGRGGPPHHLPGVVDARGVTVTSTQRPEIGQSFAIGVYDVCMYLCGDRGNKTKPDTQGCGQDQALDFRAMGNFHDFFSSKRGFLEIRGSLLI